MRNLHAFMKVAAYRAVANELRKRKFRKNLVCIDAIPLTMPDRDETNEDDDLVEEGFFVSDGGEGAERVREDVTDRLDAGHVPKWLRLFREAMSRQDDKATEVLMALEKDRRYSVVMAICGIPERTFFRILKKFASTSPNVYGPIARSAAKTSGSKPKVCGTIRLWGMCVGEVPTAPPRLHGKETNNGQATEGASLRGDELGRGEGRREQRRERHHGPQGAHQGHLPDGGGRRAS